ncbi:MAG: hypothetical protein ACYDB7_00875 [Mycobacteriales bacterium]
MELDVPVGAPPDAGAAASWHAVARRYRRVLIHSVLLGVVAVIVTALLGHPLAGACICGGLALGGYNSRRLWTETNRIAEAGIGGRRPMATSALRRLAFVTSTALVVALLYRPLGWTAFLGLLAFQALLVADLAAPLRRVIRQ